MARRSCAVELPRAAHGSSHSCARMIAPLAIATAVQHAEPELASSVILLRGRGEPALGLDKTLQHAIAALVQLRHAQLRGQVAALGQCAQQRCRIGVVPLRVRLVGALESRRLLAPQQLVKE